MALQYVSRKRHVNNRRCGSSLARYLVWDQRLSGSNLSLICLSKNIIYESAAQLDRASTLKAEGQVRIPSGSLICRCGSMVEHQPSS